MTLLLHAFPGVFGQAGGVSLVDRAKKRSPATAQAGSAEMARQHGRKAGSAAAEESAWYLIVTVDMKDIATPTRETRAMAGSA